MFDFYQGAQKFVIERWSFIKIATDIPIIVVSSVAVSQVTAATSEAFKASRVSFWTLNGFLGSFKTFCTNTNPLTTLTKSRRPLTFIRPKLWQRLVAQKLVWTSKLPRRTRRSVHVAVLGRHLQLFLRCASDHARTIRCAARQSRRRCIIPKLSGARERILWELNKPE